MPKKKNRDKCPMRFICNEMGCDVWYPHCSIYNKIELNMKELIEE